ATEVKIQPCETQDDVARCLSYMIKPLPVPDSLRKFKQLFQATRKFHKLISSGLLHGNSALWREPRRAISMPRSSFWIMRERSPRIQPAPQPMPLTVTDAEAW